ncbi:hypothetical protein NVP1123O_67 [Vibrio phage 1.123.O._10N.286.48.F3]|nr:hypothetical protein NVP1123O_67 [Vibrio phage 1.123.O._10N.286.48.F3]
MTLIERAIFASSAIYSTYMDEPVGLVVSVCSYAIYSVLCCINERLG